VLFTKDGLLLCSPFGFLTDCSHVSSLVSSFTLLPMPTSRSTFYSLSDPAPTSAPSKKIPLKNFPQGSVSLVSLFFSSCAFFWFLLLFSQLTFVFFWPFLAIYFFLTTPDPKFFLKTPTYPPHLRTRPSCYKTYLVSGIRN